MTTQTERRSARKPPVKWYVLGPAVCILSLPVFMYLCALLLARELLPFSLAEELVTASVFLAGTAGGAAGSAVRGGKAVQSGFISGCVLAAALAVAALAAPGEGALSAQCLRHAIAAAAGGAFGGALGMRRRPGKKRRKSR